MTLRNLFIATACSLVLTGIAHADPRQDYLYQCALEALNDGTEEYGIWSYCMGNSMDPTPATEKLVNLAVVDYNSARQPAGCPFEYGLWKADGSRADGFEEGWQALNYLNEVVNVLNSGRDVHLFDARMQPLNEQQLNLLFSRQSNEIVLTPAARTACPDQLNDPNAY